MAEYFKGTLLASPVVRGSDEDNYGTHHSILGVGGYMEVKTITDRNNIPINNNSGLEYDGISSGQRRLGMLVHVLNDGIIYRLLPKINNVNITLSQWNAMSTANKLLALNNNSNWHKLDISGGGTQGNLSNRLRQVSPTFSINDVVGYNGLNYVPVNSSNSSSVEPLGFVTSIELVSGNTYEFNIIYIGYIDTTLIRDVNEDQLVAGTKYYLSNTTGKITAVEPTSLNEISKPMLISLDNNNGIVLQYRGVDNSNTGVSNNEFNIYTGDTQILLDKSVTGATNTGYFSGNTGVQTLNMGTANSSYNGLYKSLYNYYYRDENGFIRYGSPTNNFRRAYLYDNPPNSKSWVYNQYTGSNNNIGWILVDGNVEENVGNFLTAFQYGGTPFNDIEWSDTGGTNNDGFYNNGNLSFNVEGSIYTGSTYNIGGPIYRNKLNKTLHLRTLKSVDENALKITHDDNFIYLSASTTGGGGNGEGTYNLASPSTKDVGGIPKGTDLIGLTSFELFRRLLVPELFGVLTPPSLTTNLIPSNTIYEVGSVIPSIQVDATFNRGSINPQWASASNFRSGLVNSYVYVGDQIGSTYPSNANNISQTVTNYIVLLNDQQWSVTVNYNSGVQPKGSEGSNYDNPLSAGSITSSKTIIGAYPIFATVSSITLPSKITLLNMNTANNVQINMVAETGTNKQVFDIPNVWRNNRPLTGVLQLNTVSGNYEYPGGFKSTSLSEWDVSSIIHTIQGDLVDYTRYKFNGVDRGIVSIRLVF